LIARIGKGRDFVNNIFMKRYSYIFILLCLVFLGAALFILPLSMKLGALILFFVSLFLLFNITPFMFKEKESYEDTDLSRLMDGRAAPIYHINEQKKCILFIHGFPSTPAGFAFSAQLAKEKGFDVMVPLLPGYGTHPSDIVKTSFNQWYLYIKDLYISRREFYEEFYICGNSLGGAIALKLMEELSGSDEFRPTAGITVSAPVFIDNPLRFFIRTISWVMPHIPRSPSSRADQDGDSEWLGYRGQFPGQAYGILMNLQKIRAELHNITCPLFLVQAKNDKIVTFDNISAIMHGVSSEFLKMRIFNLSSWKHTHHSLFLYKSVRKTLTEEILSFCESVKSETVKEDEDVSL